MNTRPRRAATSTPKGGSSDEEGSERQAYETKSGRQTKRVNYNWEDAEADITDDETP